MKIETAKDLEVYQVAYRLAMQIFEMTKHFPAEERWASHCAGPAAAVTFNS